jgi:hypothetical protein
MRELFVLGGGEVDRVWKEVLVEGEELVEVWRRESDLLEEMGMLDREFDDDVLDELDMLRGILMRSNERGVLRVYWRERGWEGKEIVECIMELEREIGNWLM